LKTNDLAKSRHFAPNDFNGLQPWDETLGFAWRNIFAPQADDRL
jgi:hypothetical protein